MSGTTFPVVASTVTIRPPSDALSVVKSRPPANPYSNAMSTTAFGLKAPAVSVEASGDLPRVRSSLAL
jgi:hypothetical protein